MNCYTRVLALYPGSVVASVGIIGVTCLVVSLTVQKLPDFSNTQLGFECRGTTLSKRSTAWENLIRATQRNGVLTTNPLESITPQTKVHGRAGKKNATTKRNKVKNNATLTWSTTGPSSTEETPSPWAEIRTRTNTLDDEEQNNQSLGSLQGRSMTMEQAKVQAFHPLEILRGWDSSHLRSNHNHFQWGDPVTRSPEHQTPRRPIWDHLQQLGTMGFLRAEKNEQRPFCDNPHSGYSHVVFASQSNVSLWNVDSLHSMCRWDLKLRALDEFSKICQRPSDQSHDCCPSWSIGHYVALLRNRTSCFDIDQEDVEAALKLVTVCARHYHGLRLSADCDDQFGKGLEDIGCADVPRVCISHNAVYHILHFLADADFLVNDNGHLSYASLFLPMAQSTAALSFYHELQEIDLTEDNFTQIVALQLGLKDTLFNEYMHRDIVLLTIGAALILALMWWYTASLFLTLMTLAAVLLSLTSAYFVYTIVFELEFFPFINLLAAVIIVGIGADDAFIFIQVWRCTKSEKDGSTLPKLVSDTLRHAGLSMFVTSFTTAAAFFSTFVCPVTPIRCFSLFAGISITIHFLLMLSWLPAAVLLSEKYFSVLLELGPLKRCWLCCSDVSRVFFDKLLPCVVIKLRLLWAVLLTAVAVAAGVVVFHYPGLRLPDSREFQLFSSDHPFERYDLELKSRFQFERRQHSDMQSLMPLHFVWGIHAEDNGNHLNPLSKGSLILDRSFDMAAPESQSWLLGFCKRLREQPFYQPTLGPLLPNCFMETFKSWMERACLDTVDGIDRTPCCETSKFPYSPEVFNQCILLAVRDLYATPAQFFLPGVAGPRFSKTSHRVKAIVIEYDSNVTFSLSHREMDDFYTAVESWMQEQLQTAPPTMKNGWFISELSFYDVQNSLSRGTLIAIGLTMATAFLVLLFCTCNVWLSLIAVFTCSSIVLVTMAVLVLLGWKLNILESACVSLAVGLSVDFTLHFAIGYRMGPTEDRQSAVVFSLSRMGSPITMAALTSFAAGAAVLPSNVLAYRQIGTFIVVVMVTSWLYSTLLLQSLLSLVGPEKSCGSLRIPGCASCCCHCCAEDGSRVDKTVYSQGLSESTLSTSSTCCPNPSSSVAVVNSEVHELEPLTYVGSRPKIRGRSRSGSLVGNHATTTATSRKVSLPSAALLNEERPRLSEVGIPQVL